MKALSPCPRLLDTLQSLGHLSTSPPEWLVATAWILAIPFGFLLQTQPHEKLHQHQKINKEMVFVFHANINWHWPTATSNASTSAHSLFPHREMGSRELRTELNNKTVTIKYADKWLLSYPHVIYMLWVLKKRWRKISPSMKTASRI